MQNNLAEQNIACFGLNLDNTRLLDKPAVQINKNNKTR